jgi:hypothetical protein
MTALEKSVYKLNEKINKVNNKANKEIDYVDRLMAILYKWFFKVYINSHRKTMWKPVKKISHDLGFTFVNKVLFGYFKKKGLPQVVRSVSNSLLCSTFIDISMLYFYENRFNRFSDYQKLRFIMKFVILANEFLFMSIIWGYKKKFCNEKFCVSTRAKYWFFKYVLFLSRRFYLEIEKLNLNFDSVKDQLLNDLMFKESGLNVLNKYIRDSFNFYYFNEECLKKGYKYCFKKIFDNLIFNANLFDLESYSLMHKNEIQD